MGKLKYGFIAVFFLLAFAGCSHPANKQKADRSTTGGDNPSAGTVKSTIRDEKPSASAAKSTTRGNNFFSLRDFFKTESQRLSNAQMKIDKTVIYEKKSENHIISVKSWTKELSIFQDADINKSSWKDKYSTEKKDGMVTYLARDSSLKVKEIEILYALGKSSINQIKIRLSANNFLYSMSEVLVYKPDSGYSIRRMQNITLLGMKHYYIGARFIKVEL